MSLLSKTLLIVGVSVALAGAAYAQDAAPWVLKSDMGYMVDAQGKTMIVTLSTMKKDSMMKAKTVAPGTMFFLQDGRLMMVESAQR